MKSLLTFLALTALAAAAPVPVIFDTDMGNDVDDVMALAMLHTLDSGGQCKLLAVTLSKDHELAAPFVDAINTFYGRPDIPIGVVRDGATQDEGKFLKLANAIGPDGNLVFPHDLMSGKDAPEAVSLIRKSLAASEDGSVVMIQVGFFTNLSRLLDSKADDVSPLNGEELVRKKVRLLSLMAGAFQPISGNKHFGEYNVTKDISSARQLVNRWPTPRVWSGFEIGIAVTYPHNSIKTDYGYVPNHPLEDAYLLYEPPPHDRPTWDPTAVLQAVLPDGGFFQVSPPGRVSLAESGSTGFKNNENGPDRFLILPPESVEKTRLAIVRLSSQAPDSIRLHR